MARAHDGGVDVRVLVVEDCPNEVAAVALVRQALHDVGLPSVPVSTRVVTAFEEATELTFTGSPTILIDGRDPFAQPGQSPALACRIYRSPAGAAGVPELAPLREALKRAADSHF